MNTSKANDLWLRILEDARWYPSPHNSQPIKAKIISNTKAEFFYDKEKGLPAESYGIPFGFVCMGVFLEGLRVVAAAEGYALNTQLELTDMNFTVSEKNHLFARVELIKQSDVDIRKAQQELRNFRTRQTSRMPYNNQIVEAAKVEQATNIARDFGYDFHTTSDKELVKKVIAVNQETLFDDLQRDPVYFELMEWLRFSKKEAQQKSDGLSAETMLMPGRILHFAMRHRGLWELPVVGSLFKWMYLRTMSGVRQLGWLVGPFERLDDFVNAGKCFMRIWLYFTEVNIHLHPYGTVITNPNSHKKFVELVGADEHEAMAWMLFRFGHSDTPPQSFRRDVQSMIIKERS
jgi:hypothetical protein